MRAAWMAQEMLTTFNDELQGILLRPSEVNGRYTICINEKKIFDRKENGGFPEIKELKQMVRDEIAPGKSLGHADRKPLDEFVTSLFSFIAILDILNML